MVYIVRELALGPGFFFYGMERYGMLALLPLHGLRALVIHEYDLAAYVAKFIVRIVHRRYEIRVGGGTFGNGAQDFDVLSEITRRYKCKHSHRDTDDKHYPKDVERRQCSAQHIIVKRQSRVYHHPAVFADLREIEKILTARRHVVRLLLHVFCRHVGIGPHFFVAQSDRLAPCSLKAAVFVDRHFQAVVNWIFAIICANEIDERKRIDVCFVGRYDTRIDKCELLIYLCPTVLAFVVELPEGHTEDYDPQRDYQRDEKLPLVANPSP